jgi:DNA-directed RNA polymerase subunit L
MEAKIIDGTKDKARFEIYGADHNLMNLLKARLATNKDVEFVTFSQPHPLLDGFVLTIKGNDPEKLLKKGLAELKSDAKELRAAFKSAK